MPVGVDDVLAAARRLDGLAHRTPVLRSRTLDERLGARVHLKAEHLQRVGAFKFRGAANAIGSLDDEVRRRGIVAFSSGNHAQAVACAAALHGVPATIVMPFDAPAVKLAATRGYGAEVVGYDRETEERAERGREISERTGATMIPPFDHPDIVAGQGTAALELCEQAGELDMLVVPVGGGGLIAGSALAATARHPDIEVIGVEPASRRAARDALARGEVVEVPVPRTILDGQRTTTIGHIPLAILTALGVEVVGVDDGAARSTVRWLATRTKQVVEPSGAAGLAALLDGTIDVTGRRVGVVLSGGNLAPELLADILTEPDADASDRGGAGGG